VRTFIRFPKILIGCVNGPAIGIAATTLQLCDYVFAGQKASFSTPFVALGQTPEGCSSYTFPAKMGVLKANEALLMGKKFSAEEALRHNLVNDIFPDDQLVPRVLEFSKNWHPHHNRHYWRRKSL